MMKKKNRILTISIRTIRSLYKRFLSLVVMSFLGVLVFVGIRATAPDMVLSLDDYYKKNQVYDLKIVSTLGLTDEDVLALSQIPGVSKSVGTNTVDTLVQGTENDFVANVHTILENMNTIELVEGKLPMQNSEVVVERALLANNDLKIGDTLELDDDAFVEKQVTIVGVIDSPLYIEKRSRGTTNLKTGTIDYYMYVLPSNIHLDYYSEVYLSFADSFRYETNSSSYVQLSDEIYKKVEAIQKEREEFRSQEIYEEASSKFLEQKEEVESNFSKAEQEFRDAKQKLDASKRTLDNTKKQLDSSRKQLEDAKNQYQNALQDFSVTESQIDNKLVEFSNQIAQLEQALLQYDQSSTQYSKLSLQLEQLKGAYTSLNTLKISKETIEQNEKSYQMGLKKYEQGYLDYQKGVSEYEKNYQKYEQEKLDALDKLEQAERELNSLDKAKWYLYDRMDETSYSNFINDADSISNLAKLFPTVFFVIAIFISLVSMSRMVEEDRIEIGTLKSLGFSNSHILLKYFIFSFFATLLGGFIGSVAGFFVIPNIIWNVYKIIFDVPRLVYSFELSSIFLGIGIAFICICGVTVFTVLANLRSNTAELLRGKAPKSGKRVFLEKIPFLWKHFRFSQKVTVRNIFRYQKRVWMTLLGVSGCTALLLCGFGIRDSIVNITSIHFGRIFTYQEMVYVQPGTSNEKIASLFQDESIDSYVETEMGTAEALSDSYDAEVTLFVPKDSQELDKILNMYDVDTKEKLSLGDSGVIITDKLASLMNLKVGDVIHIKDNDGKEHFLSIERIIENYVGHYVYMSRSVYEKEFGNYETNAVYLNTDFDHTEVEDFRSRLLENDEVLSVMVMDDFTESIDNMLNSLNSVVFILIFLSASLAFVVMYNISNVNISERKREIATLKVLGFYDKEVDNYIIRENTLLTILGVSLGLILGYFLTHIIITTVEIDKIRFIREIQWYSYTVAALITMFFTFVVNRITHHALKKIDMTSSLKSVE